MDRIETAIEVVLDANHIPLTAGSILRIVERENLLTSATSRTTVQGRLDRMVAENRAVLSQRTIEKNGYVLDARHYSAAAETIEYSVMWRVELDAVNPRAAANLAREYQRGDDSIATVYEVTDPNGKTIAVDTNAETGG